MNSRIILFLLLLFHYSLSAQSVSTQKKKINILFVGNSLTYSNSLPDLVKELGKQDEVEIKYYLLLFPDYSLEDHWNEGKVQKELYKGKFDFVIAQQGPSALPESQILLLEYTKKFKKLCDSTKAKLALYMVWPSKARLFDLDNVIYSYTHAAGETRSLLCPAGLAWKNAWALDTTLTLYSADNFHPGITGSVLAALTIYGTVTGKNDFDFIRYKKVSWHNEISKEKLNVLKQAATGSLKKQGQ